MKPDIRSKISELLSKGIESEAEVVYFLCQLRKLSEDENGRVSLPIGLSFYVDWALHSVLDRNSSLKYFISQLDDNIDSFLKGKSLSFKFFDDLSFSSFYEETLKYLSQNSIDDCLLDEEKWNHFASLYREVVLDCPLKYKTSQPKYIKELKLSGNESGDYPFEWHFFLKEDILGLEKLRVQLRVASNKVKGCSVYLD